MKKKDLLLSDFENLEIKSLQVITGGDENTNSCCTDGDEGCCDTDEYGSDNDTLCKPIID